MTDDSLRQWGVCSNTKVFDINFRGVIGDPSKGFRRHTRQYNYNHNYGTGVRLHSVGHVQQGVQS